MNYEDFKKRIEAFRATRLTAAEKEAMLAKIFEAPSPSPYAAPGWQVFFVRHRRVSFALSAMLVFFLVGGSAMYAAEGTVPGNLLYAVKVAVSEPLRDAVYRAPEARASWEQKKAERRLEEAESLARAHKLDEPRRLELEKKFEKHSDDFNAALAKLPAASTSTAEKTGRAKREFDSAVSSRAEALDDIIEKPDTPETEKEEIKKFKEKVIFKIERQGKNKGGDKEKGEKKERTEKQGIKIEKETKGEERLPLL